MTPPSRDEARERLDAILLAAIDREDAKALARFFMPDDPYGDRKRAVDAALALLSPEQGWREIETAPKDRPFWARQSNGEIALCWRHAPSSRTDEIVTWKGNRPFRAVDWRLPDPLPAPPTKGGE